MSSPTPPKKEQTDLGFYEALKEIMVGNLITKKEWKDKNTYGLLKDGRLTLKKADGYHDWILSDGDLHGDDFVKI